MDSFGEAEGDVFQAVLELAKERGYLQRPEYLRCREEVPGWLADLWADGGIARFEQRLGLQLPVAVRGFYELPELVVCIHSLDEADRDFFFAETEGEPCVCRWGGQDYLAVAMHSHSGGVYGVRLGAGDDPPMATGFEDEAEASGPFAKSFSGFIRRAVRRGPPHEYPERKQRELTAEEKQQLRQRIERGDADIFALAREFNCSASQVAGIKAAMSR
jgi:hypothetical protein